jgi:hypothetical protein
MAIPATSGPHYDHHPFAEETDRGYPLLAIVGPIVGKVPDGTVQNMARIGEIQTSFD